MLAVVAVGAGACGSDHDEAVAGNRIVQFEEDLLPSSLLGLEVTREDMADTLARADQAYVDAVGLYSFRKDNLLQATLQISRFVPEAKFNTPKFRRQVIDRLGTTAPRLFRLGTSSVYFTTGKKQTIAAWFRGPYLLVLAMRDDFDQPRALLRQTLRLEP